MKLDFVYENQIESLLIDSCMKTKVIFISLSILNSQIRGNGIKQEMETRRFHLQALQHVLLGSNNVDSGLSVIQVQLVGFLKEFVTLLNDN